MRRSCLPAREELGRKIDGEKDESPRRRRLHLRRSLSEWCSQRRSHLRTRPARARSSPAPGRLSDKVNVTFAKVQPPKDRTSDLHILAFNDLHGNLQPDSPTPLNIYGHFAGGAAYLAKYVKDKQALYGASQATVFAGDNIGAAPLANGLFHEEPITIASNLMHVDFASVGNHEFDKGSAELLRIQNGGCHPDGCTGAPYALANGGVDEHVSGRGLPVPVRQRRQGLDGHDAVPGVPASRSTSQTPGRRSASASSARCSSRTPTIVTPTGVAGLTFQDEADAANRAVQSLAADGVKIPVLVIHQGGFQSRPGGAQRLRAATSRAATSPRSRIASIRRSRSSSRRTRTRSTAARSPRAA